MIAMPNASLEFNSPMQFDSNGVLWLPGEQRQAARSGDAATGTARARTSGAGIDALRVQTELRVPPPGNPWTAPGKEDFSAGLSTPDIPQSLLKKD